jgi:branched-chain amino acid transport system ATP-binding protein
VTPLLQIRSLDAGYGDFHALFDVEMEVHRGETVAVIGANGAGKSTLLRAIVGQVRLFGGSVRYADEDLHQVAVHQRVLRGIALVPEGRRVFPSLTVRENLLIGGWGGRDGPWQLNAVVEALPLLERLLGRSAARLSGGEQQALAIGRALMSNPDLILLDEVSLGLAPVVVRQIYEALPKITGAGTTAIVVEQDITQAMAVADRVYCLLEGRVSLTGTPGSLSEEQITHAYFGIT